MNVRSLFNASAIAEVLVGVGLIFAPQLVVDLLLGGASSPTGIAVARLLGVGLLSLGIAVWELPQQEARLPQRAGICLYNVGAAALFLMLGALDGIGGILLWPAAGFHALVGAGMLWVILGLPSKGALETST